MLGWRRRPHARASRSKRARKSARCAWSGTITFSATVRSVPRCTARNTAPIPPRPSMASTRYFPSTTLPTRPASIAGALLGLLLRGWRRRRGRLLMEHGHPVTALVDPDGRGVGVAEGLAHERPLARPAIDVHGRVVVDPLDARAADLPA